MPRTHNDIINEINTAANGFQELSELQANTSKVAFWKTIKDVVAFAILTLETLFEKHKAEVSQIVNTTEIGSRAWYVAETLKYQHGDILIIKDNLLSYNALDPSKHIVKKVSVLEDDHVPGKLIFKVLKAGNALLSSDELDGLKSYLNQKKILGTHIAVETSEANLVKFEITAELDRQVFKSDGKRISDQKEAVKEAIDAYLSQMPFDGVFYVSRLESALQTIAGVKDAVITLADYKTPTGIWLSIDRTYTPSSGWLKADSGTVITYV